MRTARWGNLLGAGFELAEIHKLYECLDRLMVHKRALFDHLTQRWKDLFNTKLMFFCMILRARI